MQLTNIIRDVREDVERDRIYLPREDLVRFGMALARGELLKKETVDKMWRRATTNAGKPIPYGLGFRIVKADKPRVVGHSGGCPASHNSQASRQANRPAGRTGSTKG